MGSSVGGWLASFHSHLFPGCLCILKAPNLLLFNASHLSDFFSPQRRLRSVMKTTSGLFVSCTQELSWWWGSHKKTLYVSPLSLIRAPLTAFEMVPRRPEWAEKRHGLPAHRKLFWEHGLCGGPAPRSASRSSDSQARAHISPPQEAYLTSQPWCGHHTGQFHGAEYMVAVADFSRDDETDARSLANPLGSSVIPLAAQPR